MNLHRWSLKAYSGSFRRVFSALASIRALTPVIVCLISILAIISAANSPVANAAPGINRTINFQGRLFDSTGAVVPDGWYNIEFKIYQDGDGQSVGTTGTPAGTPEWTETHINNNASLGIRVKNGFLSVELGAKTPFSNSVDWNQDTLWLSMNIAGRDNACVTYGTAPCAADGEMVPMKRMTATPYSLNSGALNGLTSSNFVQLAQGVQTDVSTNSSIFINKTNTGNLIQMQNATVDIFTVTNAGDLQFGANANHTLNVATSSAGIAGRNLTIGAGGGGSGAGSAGGTLTLQGGAAGGTDGNGGGVSIDAGAATGTGTRGTISIGTANAATINIGTGNTGTTNVNIGTNASAAGGTTTVQSKGNTAIATNGTTRATFDTTGKMYVGDGITAAGTGTFSIQGSTGAASNAGYGVTIQGGTGGTGTTNGGDVTLQGGAPTGGLTGQVVIGSAARFGTVNTGNISVDYTLTSAQVDHYTVVAVNMTGNNKTVTVPAPTVSTVGRLLYVTNVGTQTFTLAPTGGVSFSLNPGASSTFLWNGIAWTNAGVDAGSASFILNQIGSAQTTANFWISGTGRADTSVLSPLFKTADLTVGSGSSADVSLRSGDGVGGTRSSGNITIDVGSATATAGTISMGTTYTTGITIGRVGVTTTNNGNLTVGGSAGSGTTFTNNGATVNTALAVSNDADGGVLGGGLTAAQSVNIYTSFTINQTTANQSITIPSPTVTTAGRIIYIANIGSVSLGLLGSTLNNGSTASLLWNGTAWTFAGADGTSINNQKTAGQNGDFWIQAGGSSTGIGRADGGLQAPSLERATSGAMNIGTTSTTTSLALGGSGATGGITIQGGTTSTVAINTSGAGTVALGGGSTASIDVGSVAASATASTIRIGTSSGAAQTLTMGSTASTSTTVIQGGVNGTTPTVSVQAATNGYIAIGTTNANTIQVGAVGATANNSTVNIANSSAGAQTVNVGSSSSTSTTTILGGVNGTTPTVSIQGATNAYLALGTTNANTINIGTLNSAGTTNVTLGSASGATAGTTTIQSKGDTTFATNGTTRATFSGSGNTLYVGNANGSGVHATPNAFTIQGTSNSGTGAGGALTVQAGNSGSAANGANLTLSGGTGGNGINGLVTLTTPTFQTYNTGTAYSCATGPCNIPQASVDNNAVVVVSATNTFLTLNLPNPSISGSSAYGRIIYITGGNSSQNFTLSINGGGSVSNLISMRANASATLVWGPGDGTGDWTAAGASSSTTLQAAYDNTIQSSGGAELIVTKTSNTNGLTIRDSTTNSVNGALLSVQSNSAANLFSISSNVTEYTSNGGAESYDTVTPNLNGFPSSTWTAAGGATITRSTTAANIATGQGSVSVAATSSNDGVKNTLTSALNVGLTYNVSFSTILSSGSFSNMTVDYSKDGSGTTSCAANQQILTKTWTRVSCSFTVPSGATASNAIWIRQATGVSRTFYVDNLSVTASAGQSYATDGGVDSALGSNWIAVGGSATQATDNGQEKSNSARITTTASATSGIKNKLAVSPLPSTGSTTYLYRVSAYVQTQTTALTAFKIRYARDNTTNFVDCVDYNQQTVSTSLTAWQKITCIIQTDTTAATDPYIYFEQGDTTVRTSSLFIDSFSMTLANSTTPSVQIGGGSNGGPTTLFTLDKGASAPIASDNQSLLGSMYYDTTLGKLQCYEADGWGACGSSPDVIVTLSPEYTNAVMHGTGVGTMTSDLCSGVLNINDPTNGPQICNESETYNFYKWTSPQASAQTYSIYVTYQLPTTFKAFASGSTNLYARVSSLANASVKMQIYKNDGSTLALCGTDVTLTTTADTWQNPPASGLADPSTCGFAPGNSIVFKITASSVSNANAYIGNLGFTFSNK